MSLNRSLERLPPVSDTPLSGDEEEAMMAQVNAILPEIDEDDPEFQAYMREAVQEAVDDPGPYLSSEEVFARLQELYREDMRQRGLNP